MTFTTEPTTEEKILTIYREAKKDLVSLYKIFLSGDNYKNPAEFHYKISDILLNQEGHFAIEAFRESAKSSYVLQAFPLYCLLYPNKKRRYIVIIKQNQRLAEAKVKEIGDMFTGNPLLRIKLKKIKEQSVKTIEFELENQIVRFEAYGKGSSLRGLVWGNIRPDIVIMDDVQDNEDATSETIVEKDWDWFLSDVKPLGKNTRIFMIGNNLGQKSLIERVIELKDELGFKTMVIPAIENDIPTWGEQFGKEYLEREKNSYRSAGKIDIWYRERLCLAISDESRDFKQGYFQYYEELPKNMTIKIGVDPAISQKESADYTGISVTAMSEGRIYVLETIKKKMLPDEIIGTTFNLIRKWNSYSIIPIEVGVEVVQYQKMLVLEFRKQMVIRQMFFKLREITPMGEKEARIRSALQARFAAMNVYHKPIMGELEEELLSFPMGKNDDLIDAFSMSVMMLDQRTPQTEVMTYVSQEKKHSTDLQEVFQKNNRGNILRPKYTT